MESEHASASRVGLIILPQSLSKDTLPYDGDGAAWDGWQARFACDLFTELMEAKVPAYQSDCKNQTYEAQQLGKSAEIVTPQL